MADWTGIYVDGQPVYDVDRITLVHSDAPTEAREFLFLPTEIQLRLSNGETIHIQPKSIIETAHRTEIYTQEVASD